MRLPLGTGVARTFSSGSKKVRQLLRKSDADLVVGPSSWTWAACALDDDWVATSTKSPSSGTAVTRLIGSCPLARVTGVYACYAALSWRWRRL